MENIGILGPLQLQIMHVLWDNTAPQTARQITDALNDKGARNVASTVTTTLATLEKYGLVYRDKSGAVTTYESVDGSKTAYQTSFMLYAIDCVFNGDKQALYDALEVITITENDTNALHYGEAHRL